MNIKQTRHAVYNINYHLVFCPKYRRPVLSGPVSNRLVELIREIVPRMGGDLLELVVRPDHVHMFVSFPPTIAPYQIMHQVKGETSHALREQFPWLKTRIPSLWTRSYYCGTAGTVSSETVRKYIEAQEGR